MARGPSFLEKLLSPADEQLMWRVKLQDDHHAFADLMARWEKPIHALCIRMTGHSHRADDLPGDDGAEPSFVVAEQPGPDALADQSERAGIVRDALLKLAPHYREVVV